MYSSYLKADPGAGDLPLYNLDELDVLRDELLEAYSSPRDQIISHDEYTELKRTEFLKKETQRLTFKKEQDESTQLKIKAKQEALKRFYENVLSEKDPEKKQHRTKKRSGDSSVGSFHKLYTVYHDPISGAKAKIPQGEDTLILDDDDPQTPEKAVELPVKVIVPKKTPESPSKIGDSDNLAESQGENSDKLTESSGRERSKFVLKHRMSKPPPLVEGMRRRASHDMRHRKDVRYSELGSRYSFDVDVLGPFLTYVDHDRKPKMRTVATQVMMMDELTRDGSDMGSQTDFDVEIFGSDGGSWKGSSDKGSQGEYNFEEEEEADRVGSGDASNSEEGEEEHDEEEEDEGEEEEEETENLEGKVLERKESKRRDAETLARPRGYRDLDLRESITFVTFEAETNVSAHDLDREEAKRRGETLTKDNILWPTSAEFDMDTAGKRIEDYIKRCWTLDSKWLFVVQPLEVYHDSYRKKYVFEVKFSIPSPTTPVPPATASVFFVFEIPIYSSRDEAVKVSYVLEGTRFPHQPGKIPFQDKWLWGIISDKIRVQKAINLGGTEEN